MKTAELNKLIETIPTEQRQALLAIIDLKTESDMREVITKIDTLDNRIAQEMKTIENRFENKFDTVNGSIKMLMWVVGIMGMLMVALKFIK